jgi:plastocyanin
VIASAAGVVMVGWAGCGSSGDKATTSPTEVGVADFSFSPAESTIQVGNTITWTNNGQVEHTVKGPGFFSSKALGPGQRFSHRFNRPGRFPYVCTLHPTQMRATVVVRR